jgi:hypothetical protein
MVNERNIHLTLIDSKTRQTHDARVVGPHTVPPTSVPHSILFCAIEWNYLAYISTPLKANRPYSFCPVNTASIRSKSSSDEYSSVIFPLPLPGAGCLQMLKTLYLVQSG